ncbi:MAG: hypothetical protein ACK5IM_01300 [Demequina sp.]|uniref:hypothetical protein n=1 Tax=Demequina sp. TaxID=2050685 RepID=UPI003A8A98FF
MMLSREGPDDNASTLWIPSPSCGGDPEVTVEEGAVTVTLTLVATSGQQASCAEYVEVELNAPLAERAVIDGVTGRELEVEGRHS